MAQEINYHLLSNAISFYKSIGYKYVEVPWIVSRDITKITHPDNKGEFSTSYGDLVGSAEQSFIFLNKIISVSPNKYVAITPCFREDEQDELHQKYFMKVELYQNIDVNIENLHSMINDAKHFFSSHTDKEIDIVETGDLTFDIMCEGIELGSYGIRTVDDVSWIYGTGLAEPRFSIVKNK